MDFSKYRELFPVTKNVIYFNHAAVAPVSKLTQDAIVKMAYEFSNYGASRYSEILKSVELCRKKLSQLINSEPKEIAFVKNTSHGLSIVASGINWKKGDNVIIAEGEFPSNVYPWLNLKRLGVEIRTIPLEGGRIHLRAIEPLIDLRTRLLSISSVEYFNGFRNDLKAIGELLRKKNVLFCVDGIQSLGMIPMDVKKFKIDFLAADGHKWLLAPEGTGLLYVSKDAVDTLHPSIVGWKSVENATDFSNITFRLKKDSLKFEEGSFNTLGIAALEASASLLLEAGIDKIEKYLLKLTGYIIKGLKSSGAEIKSPLGRGERSSIVTFRIKEKKPEALFNGLMANKIFTAIRDGNIRISPHFYNTYDEADIFLDVLRKLKKS